MSLEFGSLVILSDQKGRNHTLLLEEGKQFFTTHGSINHDEIKNLGEGSVISSSNGMQYTIFSPSLQDYVVNMPRGAAVIYPKDAAQIIELADIKNGIRVLEAGVGSGALTISLLRAVGDLGKVDSYERREEFATIARKNVEMYFGEVPKNWSLTLGSVQDAHHDKYDRIVLDMLAPWECVDMAISTLEPGGVLMAYVATTTQLSEMAETIKKSEGFTEPESIETILRGWHHEGLAVRPQHRMIGHTGFLIMARRLAPGTIAPLRRRRPSKGSYGLPEDEA